MEQSVSLHESGPGESSAGKTHTKKEVETIKCSDCGAMIKRTSWNSHVMSQRHQRAVGVPKHLTQNVKQEKLAAKRRKDVVNGVIPETKSDTDEELDDYNSEEDEFDIQLEETLNHLAVEIVSLRAELDAIKAKLN